jgi:uncharacterized repeat protein (TIGR02059 family)
MAHVIVNTVDIAESIKSFSGSKLHQKSQIPSGDGRRPRSLTRLLPMVLLGSALIFTSTPSPKASATGTPLQPTDPIAAFHNPNDNSNFRLRDVAVAPDGSVYVSDSYLDIIGKVPASPTSPLQVVVGVSNSPGTGTDGSAATSFAINNPMQLAFDPSGNLYFSDATNNRVVKVNLAPGGDGTAKVVATGFNTPGGIAVASDGTVYVADAVPGSLTTTRKIWKVPYNSGSATYGTAIAMFTGTSDKPYASPYNDAFQNITLSADGSILYVISNYSSYASAPQNLSTILTTSPYTRQVVLNANDVDAAFAALTFPTFGNEVAIGPDGKLYLGVSGGIIRIDDLSTKTLTQIGGNANFNTAGSMATYNGSSTFGTTATLSNQAIAFAPSGKFYYLGNFPAGVVQVSPPDLVAPVLSSAVVSSVGTQLTLTYGEALSSSNPPASSQFAVTSAGAAVAVSSLSVSGSTVVLTLGAPVELGAVVTVSYTDAAGNDANAIQDAAGNDAVSLVAQSVTNNSTQDLTAPVLSSAVVSSVGTQLTLTYGEALSSSNPPASCDGVVYGRCG